ncbi:MAG: hypothetical protein H7840_15580, partial [Alphaproteobacteria bacterium]
MVHGAVRHFFQILSAFGLLVIIIGPLAAWRVSSGPVAVDFLIPYIVEALTPASGAYRVGLDGAELHWAGWKRSLDINAVGVTVTNPDGRAVVTMPTVSLSLSLRALRQGIVAPSLIEIRGSRLRLRRTRAGHVDLEIAGGTPADGAEPLPAALLEEMLAPPDPGRASGYLRQVRLVDATVLLEDEAKGGAWRLEDLDIELGRDADGIGAAGGVSLVTPDGTARLDIGGRFPAREREPSFTATFSDIRPTMFSHLAPDLEPLAGVELPLSGSVSVKFDRVLDIERIGFAIDGRRGRVTLPALGADYDIHGLSLRGKAVAAEKRMALEALEIDLGGPKVSVTASLEQRDPPPVVEAPPPPAPAVVPDTPPKGKSKAKGKGKKSRAAAKAPPPPIIPL